MMSILERVSPEVRRKTGWIPPMVALGVVSSLGPDTGRVIGRSEQLWSAGLALAGVAVGILWQWFSPRHLADRLAMPAGALVVVALLMLLPLAGEMRQSGPGYLLWFPSGVLAGLVLMTGWQRLRSEDD